MNCDSSSHAGGAVQGDAGIVVSNGMLDDGKSQASAAGLLGVALIYSIKPLEDPILMLSRNADTGIFHHQTIIFSMDRYPAAGNIVLDGVVAEVIDHLMQ